MKNNNLLKFCLLGFAVASAFADDTTVTYGDRSQGSKGLRLQTLSTDNLLLPIFVDLEGKGRFSATGWPPLRVSGARGLS